MNLIKPRIHLFQDTVISSYLILAPLFFPLGMLAQFLSVFGGIFIFGYVHVTKFPGAILPRMSRKTHLILDLVGILVALLLPWILFSEKFERYYFFSVGLIATPLLIFSDFQLKMSELADSTSLKLSTIIIWLLKVTSCFIMSWFLLFSISKCLNHL